MSKKTYILIAKGESSVLIKDYVRDSINYPYNPIYSYIEVSAEIDRESLKIKTYKGTQEWSYRLLRHENDSLANWQSRDNAARYVPEKAIQEAESLVKKIVREKVRQVKEGRNNPIWLTLKPLADKMIKHYASDFYYHDCLSLQINKPARFIWLVRNTGTWLLLNKSEWNRQILQYQEKENENRIYYYDQGDIVEITINDAWNLYRGFPSAE